MLVGAFDPSAWTGLVFAPVRGNGFALQFAVDTEKRRFEGHDFLDIVHEVGPCAPDGSYARMAFDHRRGISAETESLQGDCEAGHASMTVEWSKSSDDTCVGRVRAAESFGLECRAYYPWDWNGSWTFRKPEGCKSLTRVSLLGETTPAGQVLSVSLFRSSEEGGVVSSAGSTADNDQCRFHFGMSPGDVLWFTAVAGTRAGSLDTADGDTFDPDEIDRLLARAEARYAAERVTVNGYWDGLAASITNNLHWMTALKPECGTRYTPAGRKWIFPRHGGGRDHWTVFCWDAFFNALELGLESPELARETLHGVLDSQYENGNIPNWRGRFAGTPDRSQPPIGSFVTLKLFSRTGDRQMLERAFPILDRWSAWWRESKRDGLRRDGNGNGLFEWGCDLDLLQDSPAHWENEASYHQLAAWESGQDDLPNWDDASWMSDSETYDLESVDLNSLIALDFECLREIAAILGYRAEAERYGRLYEEISSRINELLWDENSGMYVDRFWNGRSSSRLAASNFYPLVAGVAPQERAERILSTLLDEKKFWGEYVLPTISRDDPVFGDQQYWRGTIWPPTNYLVYQGLKRYHFDEVAALLARRSVDLFLGSWQRFQLCRENYDSRTGAGGGQKYQSWGPLFALMGIEEFIDVTPWEGLRIGTLFPPDASELSAIRVRDHLWKVKLSDGGIHVSVDGNRSIESSSPIVLREVELEAGSIRGKITASKATDVTISFETDEIVVTVDGVSNSTTARTVHIPAGEHTLSIAPLSDLT